ncbi:MAG TPA: signal recognition particle-docking protein FtsY [Candidatus Binataceae bacterium]|nr:signal recognition particle-docking protein FtsY [Candidatus Binataceae bacterium]
MTPVDNLIIVLIALVGGLGLIFTGVLIQWSLRKARPSAPIARQEFAPPQVSAPEFTPAAVSDRSPDTAPLSPAETAGEDLEAPAPSDKIPAAAEAGRTDRHPGAAASAFASPLPVRAPVRIGMGLRKTRENFLARIRAAITGAKKIDEIYEGLEEALIAADVGVEASMKLAGAVRKRLGNDSRPEVIRDALKAEISAMLAQTERAPAAPTEGPIVIMLVGVNGVGKTTTVAKLAARLRAERGGVIVAAADTFRAAAIEQLEIWCDRVGAEVIKHQPGSDPAAVAFDAVRAGLARNAGAVIIDTAGRLQTKTNLMEELKKIARVIARELPGAPHETWLVLDANTGQNALSQAKIFGEAVPLTGVVLAKLDSTAKGGVIVAIADRLRVPVRFVGLGEGVEDLREFDAKEFVEALFEADGGEAAGASGSYAA